MTAPLPPRRRDTTDRDSLLRHSRQNLRQLGVGFIDGRFPLARPLGSTSLLGDLEDDQGDDGEALVGEDGDRLYLWDLGSQSWQLTAPPVDETLVVRFHPGGGAGIEWKRGEHYALDGNVVTITPEQLVAARAQLGDVFSAQYLRTDDETAQDFVVDWGSGWKYKAVSGTYVTNAVDHSTTDSSGWSVGQAPLGHDWDGSPGWSPRKTTVNTAVLWIQREVFACEAMTIRVRVEDNCKVYVNGTLVGTIADHAGVAPPETAFTVPEDALNTDAPNLIAIKVANEVPVIADDLYVDVRVEGTVPSA